MAFFGVGVADMLLFRNFFEERMARQMMVHDYIWRNSDAVSLHFMVSVFTPLPPHQYFAFLNAFYIRYFNVVTRQLSCINVSACVMTVAQEFSGIPHNVD